MALDLKKYTHHLDDNNLSEGRKLQIVRLVHDIMEAQIDQAFGIHPVQCCGYDKKRDSRNKQGDQYLETSKATPTFSNESANDNLFNRKAKA